MVRFTPHIIPPGSWQAQADYAKAHDCVAVVVIHRNSGGGRYTMVEVGSNASAKSVAMAKDLAARFKKATGLPFPADYPSGVRRISPPGARGDACVRYFAMPDCLGEVNFNDVKAQDDWSEVNWRVEARCYYEMLVAQFPAGGNIGIAIGHYVNGSSDTGAGDYDHDVNEREMNWKVGNEVSRLLAVHGTIVVPPPAKPQPYSGNCKAGLLHVRVEKEAVIASALSKLGITVVFSKTVVPVLDAEMKAVMVAEVEHAASLMKV